MLNSIIAQLKLVKDFRKNRGKRHELWVVLTIIILALLTGKRFLNIPRHRYNCENDRLLLVFGWGQVAANTRDSVFERSF
jgi:hypothetical protein